MSFRDDVELDLGDDSVSLATPVSTFILRPVHNGFKAALAGIARGPVRLADLLAPLVPAERAQFRTFLDRAGHLLARSVFHGSSELVRIEPTARDAAYHAVELPTGAPVRLSKFAFYRSRANSLVLESPLAKVRVLLVHRVARELVAEIGAGRTVTELVAGGLPVATVAELLGHLVGAGFVDIGTPDGRFASDDDPVLRQWDFHDLLFHSRIRSGRYDDPLGGAYPYLGEIGPLPAVKTMPDGPSLELYRPALDEIVAHDPGLTAVIEGRRSVREYGERPLIMRQLGEFLYRVARVRAHFVPGEGEGDESAARPYPSGGAAYELELYLTVRRCHGVAQGIYYYDPVGHRLILVNSDAADRAAMLSVASVSAGMAADPDVLITMTSRFQRLSWKYRGIAYATTIRHTGVLYQTMYLVATAMGLGPCGLGIGDADLAARVLNLDHLSESSVGDFLLGSLKAGEPSVSVPDERLRTVNDAGWAVWADSALRECTTSRLPT